MVSKRAISIIIPVVFCITSVVHPNIFLDAARVKVDKVTDKKPVHKSPIEFKQAVIRYLKNTDLNFFQNIQRSSDENVAYKKELRYLFKNYGKFSAITLLSRLRSAHQAMVKYDVNVDGEAYQQYEQLCSALLLTCAQVFCNEMRNHILHALHDIDNMLNYWCYQHNHQVYYFFHKSPTKWIMGQEQQKEIAHNIVKLERKQKELYTLLGSLTEHVHSFTTVETTYEDCYVWIEQLFEIAAGVKISSQYSTDESRFDEIATVLELKLKRVAKFKADYLTSIAQAKKPSRFARNWIAYTATIAAMAYMVNYHSKNPDVASSAFKAVQDEAKGFFVLLLHPIHKIYERGKLALSTEKKIEAPKEVADAHRETLIAKQVELMNLLNEQSPENEDGIILLDKEAQLFKLLEAVIKVGDETVADINAELAKSNTSVREDGFNYIKEALELYPSYQIVKDLKASGALEKIKNRVEPVMVGKIIINEKEVNEYKAALREVSQFVDQFSQDSWCITSGSRSSWWDVNFGLGLIRADDDYLNVLEKYTKIIDQKILKIFQIAAHIVENVGLQANDLFKNTEDLEIQARQQLKDHELTLMFTSLIPLAITGLGLSKAYQWANTRDYSSIRISLSDVNALLIEAAHNLDDYHYGKLVYLICKLRHKSTYLKDPLANQFLDDVAKLESKQYSAQTKHSIVENMFNKYAFLGKVAV